MCLCLRPPPCLSVCVWVGVCSSALPGGEVAVKSVLFSPVGRICSLQICTARYCNRSHGCCSRCCRLQRRVRTNVSEPRAVPWCHPPPPSPPPEQHRGLRLPAHLGFRRPPPSGLACAWHVALAPLPTLPCSRLLALTPVSLFVTSNSLLSRLRAVLQNLSEHCI